MDRDAEGLVRIRASWDITTCRPTEDPLTARGTLEKRQHLLEQR